jgi:hypothetical protein
MGSDPTKNELRSRSATQKCGWHVSQGIVTFAELKDSSDDNIFCNGGRIEAMIMERTVTQKPRGQKAVAR